jgi:hypothetical protein
MSTAFFPLGMKGAMPASGYNHKSTLYNVQYIPWKGTGFGSNPVGTAAGHIRPLTNKDSGNVFPTGFGLPRPIKHYRKGRVIPPHPIEANNLVAESPYNKSITLNINEAALINYNINRWVKSSKGTSLGGGFGGSGLLNSLQDMPGAYIVKPNSPQEVDNIQQLDYNCKSCEGVGIVVNYMPNPTYLTENPEPNVENRTLCCNEEFKAKRRVIYADTNLKKNYYTTHYQYLQNRCKTYDQKVFNFQSNKPIEEISSFSDSPFVTDLAVKFAKPGSPLALLNTYFANCFPNGEIYQATETALANKFMFILYTNKLITKEQYDAFDQIGKLYKHTLDEVFNYINGLPEPNKVSAVNAFTSFVHNPYWGIPFEGPSNPVGCKLVVYKPNNSQFAKQGAVSSSTRNLKLNVDTISTNAASIQNYNNTGQNLVTANQLYAGDNNNNFGNIIKNKAPGCNTPYPLNFYQSGPYQNKKYCFYKKLPQYQVPLSRPSTYRYYTAGSVFTTNHFSQTPRTYNTTSGTAQYASGKR